MTTPLLAIENITKNYNHRQVLSIDSLRLMPATITGIIGQNGSGKSTLMKILGFIEKPSTGTIRYQNQCIKHASASIRHKITLLTQNAHLLNRSVFQNVAHGLKLRHDTKNLKQRIFSALEAVGLPPEDFAYRKRHALSGGEAQRVALAARLILKPELLLMDEPTANVDTPSSQRIRQAALDARKQHQTTLVIVSHDHDWLKTCCDSIIHLFNGRIPDSGSANIIDGPFEPISETYAQKIIAPNQSLTVTRPPFGKTAANIPARHFSPEYCNGNACLHGRVKKIECDKNGRVTGIVEAGSIHIKIILDPQSPDIRFFPGTPITLYYNPDMTQWL